MRISDWSSDVCSSDLVTLDAAGNVWYTGNKNGTIGRFDPRTEEITVYEMPDPAAKDPHSAKFDAAGVLWFTLQHSNMIGRLDPASGEITLVTPPTTDSRPYGIKIDKEGNPWVACKDRQSTRLNYSHSFAPHMTYHDLRKTLR